MEYPHGRIIQQTGWWSRYCTEEYGALVVGLDLAKAKRARSVVIHCDSQVVTNQMNGDYDVRVRG